jgi:hypothetical protein
MPHCFILSEALTILILRSSAFFITSSASSSVISSFSHSLDCNSVTSACRQHRHEDTRYRSDQQGAASRTQHARHFCAAGGRRSPGVPEPWSSGSERRPCTEHKPPRQDTCQGGSPARAASSSIGSRLSLGFVVIVFTIVAILVVQQFFLHIDTRRVRQTESHTRARALIACCVPRRRQGRGLDFPRQLLLDPLIVAPSSSSDTKLFRASASAPRTRRKSAISEQGKGQGQEQRSGATNLTLSPLPCPGDILP